MPRPRSDTKLSPVVAVMPAEPIQRGASATAPLLPALATKRDFAQVTLPSTASHLVRLVEPSMSRPKRRVLSDASVPPLSPLHTCSLDSCRYQTSIDTREPLVGLTRAPTSPPHARASAPAPFVATAARASLL